MEFPKAEIEALWCPWRVEYFEEEAREPEFPLRTRRRRATMPPISWSRGGRTRS